MEIKLNVLLLGCLAFAWWGVASLRTEPCLTQDPGVRDRLGALEDRAAHRPDHPIVVAELMDAYLDTGEAGAAIAVAGRAAPELLESPRILHRLSHAYEASGRVDDALATATSAVSRCEAALRLGRSGSLQVSTRFGCSARLRAGLDTHRRALAHMRRLGITDPRADARTLIAYRLASRSVQLAAR